MTGAPKVLRRCTSCKNFHASYLVEDAELEKCYLCLHCWKVRSFMHPGHVNKPTETTNDLYALERGKQP